MITVRAKTSVIIIYDYIKILRCWYLIYVCISRIATSLWFIMCKIKTNIYIISWELAATKKKKIHAVLRLEVGWTAFQSEQNWFFRWAKLSVWPETDVACLLNLNAPLQLQTFCNCCSLYRALHTSAHVQPQASFSFFG